MLSAAERLEKIASIRNLPVVLEASMKGQAIRSWTSLTDRVAGLCDRSFTTLPILI